MKTTMNEEGITVNGASTVHDVHMRGLSKKRIEKDVRSSMHSRMSGWIRVHNLTAYRSGTQTQ
jgi:hypothetical protein